MRARRSCGGCIFRDTAVKALAGYTKGDTKIIMYFIIGGRCSGKRDYVRKKFGLEPKSALEGDFSGAVYDFHLYIRRLMESSGDVEACVNKILDSDISVIISDEIGCGIVPVDEFERRYRDCVGQVHRLIAERAESVVRVVCGIGVRLK